MNDNRVIEKMPIRSVAAEERERMRLWFERHDRPFGIRKRSRHGEIWVLLIVVLCAGAMFRSHPLAMRAVSIVGSHLAV